MASAGWALGPPLLELTGMDRKRMPKDLKKFFLTKARNRLVKFNDSIKDYNHYKHDRSGALQPRDLKGWLEFALTTEGWIDSERGGKHLCQIRNLYRKTLKFSQEPIDDIVKQLMDEVPVIEVQNA